MSANGGVTHRRGGFAFNELIKNRPELAGKAAGGVLPRDGAPIVVPELEKVHFLRWLKKSPKRLKKRPARFL